MRRARALGRVSRGAGVNRVGRMKKEDEGQADSLAKKDSSVLLEWT
jgi:hypothetical protein